MNLPRFFTSPVPVNIVDDPFPKLIEDGDSLKSSKVVDAGGVIREDSVYNITIAMNKHTDLSRLKSVLDLLGLLNFSHESLIP